MTFAGGPVADICVRLARSSLFKESLHLTDGPHLQHLILRFCRRRSRFSWRCAPPIHRGSCCRTRGDFYLWAPLPGRRGCLLLAWGCQRWWRRTRHISQLSSNFSKMFLSPSWAVGRSSFDCDFCMLFVRLPKWRLFKSVSPLFLCYLCPLGLSGHMNSFLLLDLFLVIEIHCRVPFFFEENLDLSTILWHEFLQKLYPSFKLLLFMAHTSQTHCTILPTSRLMA